MVTGQLEEGLKYDEYKPRMDLIAPDAIEMLGDVLGFGAQKYEDRNWELGMDWGRVYAAAQRHLNAFWSGEDFDPETGLPHLAHAFCCVMFLLAYQKRGIGKDTRNAIHSV